ncbi:hypothetical protein [Alistipes sp.]|uniref:hypothetical protein n=1 Tax=Alistipes sp. TaxID=1872444 RepID=UPI003AF0E71D
MKRTVILLLSLAMSVACVKEDVENGNPANPHEEGVEILQPRDPSLPTVPNRAIRSMATRATNSGFTKLEDFVGRSYNNITSILGDQENILYPVIDLERLRADHPSYLKKDGLFKSEMSSYAYSTDEEYERKSSVTDKISTGFRLNLGFFSIGRKLVIERTFATHVTESNLDAYGELSVDIQNGLYSLMTSSLSNKRIGRNIWTRISTSNSTI